MAPLDTLTRKLDEVRPAMQEAAPSAIAEYAEALKLLVEYMKRGLPSNVMLYVRRRAEQDLAVCMNVYDDINRMLLMTFDPDENVIFKRARLDICIAVMKIHQ